MLDKACLNFAESFMGANVALFSFRRYVAHPTATISQYDSFTSKVAPHTVFTRRYNKWNTVDAQASI